MNSNPYLYHCQQICSVISYKGYFTQNRSIYLNDLHKQTSSKLYINWIYYYYLWTHPLMSEGTKSQSRFQPHLTLYSNLFLLRPFPLIVLVKSGKQIMSHLQHPLDHLSQAALVRTVPIHRPCDQ